MPRNRQQDKNICRTIGEGAFLSEPGPGEPVFRLMYRLAKDGILAGMFEIAAPQQPSTFSPNLAWSAHKVN